jgi:hypothetical protein
LLFGRIILMNENRKYNVLRQMYFGGTNYVPGDTLEERNTQEVLTHVALGNLKLADQTTQSKTQAPAPSQASGTATATSASPAPAPSQTSGTAVATSAAPAPAPAPVEAGPAAPMTTQQDPLSPRRRYTRRDMTS